jgi:hypothetical protein
MIQQDANSVVNTAPSQLVRFYLVTWLANQLCTGLAQDTPTTPQHQALILAARQAAAALPAAAAASKQFLAAAGADGAAPGQHPAAPGGAGLRVEVPPVAANAGAPLTATSAAAAAARPSPAGGAQTPSSRPPGGRANAAGVVKVEGDRGGSAQPPSGTAGATAAGWQEGVKVEGAQAAPQLTPMEQLEAAAAAAAAAQQAAGASSSKRQAVFVDLGRSGTKQPKLWGLGASSIDFGSMPAPAALQQEPGDGNYEAFRVGPDSIPCVSVTDCYPPGWSPKDTPGAPDPATASNASEQTAALAPEEQQQQEELVAAVTAECRELEGNLGGRVALAVHTAASAAAAGLLIEPPVVLDSGCVVVVVSLARSAHAGGSQQPPKVQVKQEEGATPPAAGSEATPAAAPAPAAPPPTTGVHPWASLLLLVPLGYPQQPASCWYVPPSAAEAAGLVPAGAGKVKAEEGEPAQPQVQQRRMAAAALRSKAWVELCTALEEGTVGSGVAGLARAWYTAVSTAVRLS